MSFSSTLSSVLAPEWKFSFFPSPTYENLFNEVFPSGLIGVHIFVRQDFPEADALITSLNHSVGLEIAMINVDPRYVANVGLRVSQQTGDKTYFEDPHLMVIWVGSKPLAGQQKH